MKYPASLFEPDGSIASFGELKGYLRSVRYDTALRWASRRSRDELERFVASFFARHMQWAGIPDAKTQRETVDRNRYYRDRLRREKELSDHHRTLRKDATERFLRERAKKMEYRDRAAAYREYLTTQRTAMAAMPSRIRSEQARRAAEASLQKNPAKAAKQAAKAEAFKLWQERRTSKHPMLRTNEQFAAECMRRWPALTSAKVILGWCTDWNKATKARKLQSAS